MAAGYMSLSDFKEGWKKAETIDYNNPTCKDCNDCCSGTAFIREGELLRLLKLLNSSEEYRKIKEDGIALFNNYMKEGTLYGMCLFSDPETKRCKIYDNRPQVCRDFHCSKNLNKVNKDELVRGNIRLMNEVFVAEFARILSHYMID